MQPAALLGRADEISAIRQLILGGKTRLLTITGPAGVGKTSLAIAATAELGQDCPAAIWFCDLVPASDAAAVPQIIAQTVGVHDQGDEPPLERLITSIRHTPLLLLLDNFEHVIAAAPLLAQLLAACPHLKLLVTSRAPLHLRWERLFPVPMLPLPSVGPKNTIEAAMSYAAVALFVERAQAIKPAFTLFEQGYHLQARAYYTESLDLYRRLEDRLGCAAALRHIGETELYTGDVIAAQHSCEESLSIYLELNHTLGIALMTQLRANMLMTRAAFAEAEACYRQSLAAFRSIGIDATNVLINLSKILFYRGDYGGAAEGFAEALALSRKLNNKRDMAIVLTESAFLSYHQDNPEQTYIYPH